jgi:HSP20 family protein
VTDTLYRVDVHEGPDNTVVASFELPGLKKEDVNIELRNDYLTVSGECKYEGERTDGGYAIRERRFGKFTRSLPLPKGTKVRCIIIE